jgi:hypothetical protein
VPLAYGPSPEEHAALLQKNRRENNLALAAVIGGFVAVTALVAAGLMWPRIFGPLLWPLGLAFGPMLGTRNYRSSVRIATAWAPWGFAIGSVIAAGIYLRDLLH